MICDDCYHAIAAVTILTPCSKPMVDLCEQCFDMSETARLHPLGADRGHLRGGGAMSGEENMITITAILPESLFDELMDRCECFRRSCMGHSIL